jgi:hypothetical protein
MLINDFELFLSVAVLSLVLLVASACGNEPPPAASTANEPAPEANVMSEDPTIATSADESADETEAESAGESTAPVAELWELDPENFDQSTNIDNEWFPLQPGTRWVYEGFTVEEGERSNHRVVFVVTDLAKEIAGVRTLVVWDQDYDDGELVETEIAFFAQDNDGNVWHFGQYPEEYEGGQFIDAPTWITGLAGAKAGIAMKTDPQMGGPSYYQGWGPAIDWTDYATLDATGQETCVPADCYEDVLVIVETSLEEQGAFQLKYYAPGVGNVRVGWRGDDQSQEELELVDFVQLDSQALAEARAAALELEKRAYEVSPGVYAHTTPAEQMSGEELP